MLFCDNLEQIVLHRNEIIRCDELVIISGYVGPDPVRKLGRLPLKTTVIYGMYGCDGIKPSLHEALLKADSELNNVTILYSSQPVHSKCYIWKEHGKVVHALIGSANFSANGLGTPNKEVLAETTIETFGPLDQYAQFVIGQAIKCKDAVANARKIHSHDGEEGVLSTDPEVCSLPLYIIEDGRQVVPPASGINWGMAKQNGSHVNWDDAYLPIRMVDVEHYPLLFPKKQERPIHDENIARKNHRHNDSIEIIWDDGETMTGLLEGSVPKTEDGNLVLYPKQISTTPGKKILGQYLRKRLGVQRGKSITLDDLERYGRKTIDVSLQGEGIYLFDFSVPQPKTPNGSPTPSEAAIKALIDELLPEEDRSDGPSEN